MVLGTFPAQAGIPSHFTNLEMFTCKMWKHDAVLMCQFQSVSVRAHKWGCVRVCVCGQRRPSALVTLAGDRSRGWGRCYQALISVVLMTSR